MAIAKTSAKADPPFDFAQGRLFGADTRKGRDKSKDKEESL
jgi:hypothetical protein